MRSCAASSDSCSTSCYGAPFVVIPGSPANADGDVTVAVQPVVTQPASRVRGLLPVAALLVAWQLAATSDSLFFHHRVSG